MGVFYTQLGLGLDDGWLLTVDGRGRWGTIPMADGQMIVFLLPKKLFKFSFSNHQ
jgi:hypothetical protein